MGILEAGASGAVHEGRGEFGQAEVLRERCFLVEKPETRGVEVGRLSRSKGVSPSGRSTECVKRPWKERWEKPARPGHEKPRSPRKDCASEWIVPTVGKVPQWCSSSWPEGSVLVCVPLEARLPVQDTSTGGDHRNASSGWGGEAEKGR